MKKNSVIVVLIIIIIAGIFSGIESFYGATSYYAWTNQALESKILRIHGTFILNKDYSKITASGQIINCTDEEIVIQSGEVTLYCQDKETNGIFAFTTKASYNLVTDRKTEIQIPIYDGLRITNGSQEAERIYNNYQIIRIEYKSAETESRILKTIAQTGSRFVPLGICIFLPVLFSLIMVLGVVLYHYNRQHAYNFIQYIKRLTIDSKLVIFAILLIIPITFIIAGTFAFIDAYWNVAVYCSIITIFSLLFISLGVGILFLIPRRKINKKIANYLTKEMEKIKSEIKNETEKIEIEICLIEKPFKEKITPISLLTNQKKQEIRTNNRKINNLNTEISIYNKNKILSEIRYVDGLDGWQFEEYCVKMFTALGYYATRTKGSGDFGADLILNNSISLQCKLYSGPVGLHALQEVYSSMARYKTKEAWVITNSTFTKQAIEYAADANIKLINRNSLEQLIVSAFNNYTENYVVERNFIIKELGIKNSDLYSEINDLEKGIEKIKQNLDNEITELKQKLEENTKPLKERFEKLKSDYNVLKTCKYKQFKVLYKTYFKTTPV